MSPDFAEVWVYLSASPLTALTITLVAYLAGDWLYQKSGRIPVLNPVLIAVILITFGLTVTGIDYWTYFEGAQFVHFLLGPATVALAIPVAKLLKTMRRGFGALAIALVLGSSTAAVSAVFIAELLPGVAANGSVSGAEERDHAHSDGYRGAYRWPPVPDSGMCNYDRYYWSDAGSLCLGCGSDKKVGREGFCDGPGGARDWHGAGDSDQ